MIKVIFKKDFGNFEGREYTYKDFKGVEVGDIVAVDTTYGFAIAKVTQIDIVDTDFIEEQLKEVKAIVQSQKEIKAEQEKKQKYNEIIARVRKDKLIAEIATLVTEDELKLIKNMTYEDLKKFYDAIK